MELDGRDLAGGFRQRFPLNLGGEREVLLKYGVRSLHCVSNRGKRVGEVIGLFFVLIFIIGPTSSS